ncbi:hypothetical protein ACIF70_36155 [Actinacidiphila glaucinigra]|uniref:hypothetical protein n=1 Tax=Actinacidiphila glaucinigra TaxID=235986 RepID=UPI0037C8CC8D
MNGGDQVQAVTGYARRLADTAVVLRLGVRPLLVVHGSPIPGGYLEVETPDGSVYVLSPSYLVPDARRAEDLADRMFAVLAPSGRDR